MDPSASQSYSEEMRDQQARGKDPYHSGDASDGSEASGDRDQQQQGQPRTGDAGRAGSGASRRSVYAAPKDDFGRIERRDKAMAYLDNPELLMVYAQSTGDSISAARLHFMKMMCGYENEDDGGRDQSRAKESRPKQRPGRPESDKRGGAADGRETAQPGR